MTAFKTGILKAVLNIFFKYYYRVLHFFSEFNKKKKIQKFEMRFFSGNRQR
jgi:hypothetical protein